MVDRRILFIRILISALCGSFIGLERKRSSKQAGMRTHMIVCMGACLVMLISKYGFADVDYHGDPARLAAQVVSGVGFLGAGMIMVRKNMISGLTTAAGIWSTSAVGLAIGSGMSDIGIFVTAMILVVQVVLRSLNLDPGKGKQASVQLVVDSIAEVHVLLDHIRKSGGHIEGYSFEKNRDGLIDLSMEFRILSADHVRVLLGEYIERAKVRVIEP